MSQSVQTPPHVSRVTCNISGKSRVDSMEGRPYLVVPVVMITEGVHTGSNGPLYYPADELKRCAPTWNHKPVVVYHPPGFCDPDTLTVQKVGVVMNAKWDAKGKKLRAEAWLERDRLEKVDNRVLEAIEADQPMEVSTGLVTENEEVDGVWNGEEYRAIARHYGPDHLAILPDQKGACSLADGAGLLVTNRRRDEVMALVGERRVEHAIDLLVGNARSYSTVTADLDRLVAKRFGEMAFVVDVYDGWFVYRVRDDLWRLDYSSTDTQTTIPTSAPVRVERVVTYRELPVGNQTKNKDSDMARKDEVDGLIVTGMWTEADREFLMGVPDAQFGRLRAPVPPPAPAQNAAPAQPPVQPVVNATPAQAKSQTVEEYIAAAPPEVADALRDGLVARNSERQTLIARITANANNPFTSEVLGTKGLGELRALAQLAGVGTPTTNNYAGAAGSVPQPPPTQNAGDVLDLMSSAPTK